MNGKRLPWVAMGLAITGLSAWALTANQDARHDVAAAGCHVAAASPGCKTCSPAVQTAKKAVDKQVGDGAASCALPASDKGGQAANVAKPVNSICPILGIPFDAEQTRPERTRQFKGQTVGFCCGPCPGKWDKLTDGQKQEALASALQKQNAAEGTKEDSRQK